MPNMPKYDDTELWENRKLGASEKYVRKISQKREKAIDDAIGLQLISLRLEKDQIDKIKSLAEKDGMGYQPYLRKIILDHLQRHQKDTAVKNE